MNAGVKSFTHDVHPSKDAMLVLTAACYCQVSGTLLQPPIFFGQAAAGRDFLEAKRKNIPTDFFLPGLAKE